MFWLLVVTICDTDNYNVRELSRAVFFYNLRLRICYSCLIMEGGSTKQIARWIALAALFLIPLTPLLVANSYFFPFITGKAFYFRILVEIAVALWIVLALLDKEYRPRFSWIGVAVVAFVVWMFIADLFAINVAKAFWSNFERMEGWVLLAHLLGLFFAASSVLRVEEKWRAWFLASLGVSVVVSLYALLQLSGAEPIHQGASRIDATLGNSAYLAIYLLFNVSIALWLALTEKRNWLRWALIALAVLEGTLLFFTATRGTIIGFVIGLLLAAILTIFTAQKRARQYATIGLIIVMVLVGALYLSRNTSFVQNNDLLNRITSVSLADGQTRFTLWRMAIEGVSSRPVVGYGQEGYNYIFNKYYDPSLFLQEQWFDRAHNVFIDWLTAGGIPAFLLYISLFASAFVLLWRSPELSRPERIALTAALVGYAVHDLFVFDNLYSYIYFFAILALIDSQVGRPFKRLESMPALSDESGMTYALPLGVAAALVLVWTVNIPGMQAATKLITAISPSQSNPAGNMTAFEELAANPSFAAQEVREQLINFAVKTVQIPSVSDAEKQRAVSLAISEMQKQIEAYPLDAREYLQLSSVYRVIGDTEEALTLVKAAAALSPNKQQMMLEAGILLWEQGDMDSARTYFLSAYELSPQFKQIALFAAAAYIGTGDVKKADAVLLDAYGTTTVDSNVLGAAYYRTKNWPRLIELARLRASDEKAGAQAWFELAAAYYASGDVAKAIATIKAAAARFPEAKAAAENALSQMGATSAGQ